MDSRQVHEMITALRGRLEDAAVRQVATAQEMAADREQDRREPVAASTGPGASRPPSAYDRPSPEP
jgi:hypothetical protein